LASVEVHTDFARWPGRLSCRRRRHSQGTISWQSIRAWESPESGALRVPAQRLGRWSQSGGTVCGVTCGCQWRLSRGHLNRSLRCRRLRSTEVVGCPDYQVVRAQCLRNRKVDPPRSRSSVPLTSPMTCAPSKTCSRTIGRVCESRRSTRPRPPTETVRVQSATVTMPIAFAAHWPVAVVGPCGCKDASCVVPLTPAMGWL
jgi:hypothetical protein